MKARSELFGSSQTILEILPLLPPNYISLPLPNERTSNNFLLARTAYSIANGGLVFGNGGYAWVDVVVVGEVLLREHISWVESEVGVCGEERGLHGGSHCKIVRGG